MRVQVDLLPRGEERVPVQEAMALQADNNTLALAVQDLRATLAAQQKGIDNMNWQLEQKTKQVRNYVGAYVHATRGYSFFRQRDTLMLARYFEL